MDIVEKIDENIIDYIKNPGKYCEKSNLTEEQKRKYNKMWNETIDEALKRGYSQSSVLNIFLSNKEKPMEETIKIIRSARRKRKFFNMINRIKEHYF